MTIETKANTNTKEPHVYSKKRKVLSALLWIAGWPLIIGFVGTIIIIIMSGILSETGNMNSPTGYQMRGMWAGFVGLLVIVCYVFIWLKLRNKHPLNRISTTILRSYMWLGILVGVCITVIIPDPEASTANAGIDVQQTNALFKPELASDASIHATLAKVGATDTQWLETKYVAEYDDTILEDQAGEYQAFIDTAGNWSYGILSVKQGTVGAELDTIVAHEYLHHVWYKTLDEETKTKLASDLIAIYGRDSIMQERVQSYAEKQTLQPTELFSYYCTEASDPILSQYILAECSKYITRSALQLMR